MQAGLGYTSYMIGCKCKIKWGWERWSKINALIECMDVPIGFRIYQTCIIIVISTSMLGASLMN
ncbi:uncharacterized protein METZ01_LOCUS192741 [marine metagenome]|uniref:Uncharacterized protein n=1 Tax=marine metagenome TaxID=408172 RepID=A0A382DQM2_9ZZZZ